MLTSTTKWRFQPANDRCLDCSRKINPFIERHYIVFDGWDKLGRPKPNPKYRRQCADCYDAEHQRPHERSSAHDSFITGTATAASPKPRKAKAKAKEKKCEPPLEPPPTAPQPTKPAGL